MMDTISYSSCGVLCTSCTHTDETLTCQANGWKIHRLFHSNLSQINYYRFLISWTRIKNNNAKYSFTTTWHTQLVFVSPDFICVVIPSKISFLARLAVQHRISEEIIRAEQAFYTVHALHISQQTALVHQQVHKDLTSTNGNQLLDLTLSPSINWRLTTNYGKRTVKYKASKMWNQLPSSQKEFFPVKNFKLVGN